jgi:hypothetical protein
MLTSPFEVFNQQIGVQARFLYSSCKAVVAHPQSLNLKSYDAIHHAIKQGIIKKIRPNSPGQPLLVCFNSLPPTWQQLLVKAFGEPQQLARQSQFALLFQFDTAALAFYTSYAKEKDGKKAFLTTEAIQEYTLNASVLNTLQRYQRQMLQMRKTLGGSITSVWDAVTYDCNRFRAVKPHTLPEHKDNLRKKLSAYQKQGYEALISGKLLNSNARVVTPAIEALFNDLFAGTTQKPTATDVARTYTAFLNGYVEVVNDDGEPYCPSKYKPVSKSTIQQYLAKWHNQIGNEILRSGNRLQWMQKFRPYHSLEQAKFAGSIISVDDRQPPFKYDAHGSRMWFYNAIDLGSEAFTCWVYGTSKEGIITDFYRQLVRNYHEFGVNLPAELEGEMSLNSSFQNTFLQPGAMFQYVRLEANNARGKRIERYYGSLRYKYEKDRLGWLARPHARLEANQPGALPVPILAKSEIVENALRDIERWNNEPHSKIPGKTRWEVFIENQNPNIQPTNYKAILPHIGYTTATSCRAGIIHLNNAECLLGLHGQIATGQTLVQIMQLVEGQNINVYWLDDNDGNLLQAHIYIGTRYVADAVAKPVYAKARIEQTPEDDAKRAAMSSYVATVDAFIRQRKNAVTKVHILPAINTPAPTHAFTIRGLKKYNPPPQVSQPEIIELPPDADFIPVKTPFKRALIDRY